ncbi:protein painting of fourth isoform X2 [Tribolium castaneum]|uniref:protein painting of fourth isoform X2 n=1 Tax=Tribolium castaneum TaxID=7070 RepID=UPI00046BEDE8|nr:PREDICTED: protein painting of fourth isoform X2 [Tribolium castaneum]|eukprot:XP_008192964.1 PREDICTED: protein painting of fourth isoform X2 [Tribolium castaneum]
MSGNGYGYYYAASAQSFPVNPNQSWSEWSLEQQQYNNSTRNAAPHPLNHVNNHTNAYVAPHRSQNHLYNANNRHYQQRRYTNPNQTFPSQQQPWQRNNYKRPRPQDSPNDPEPKSKTGKKKKKPLSQNVPSKKDWTLEEAEMALNVEKEYNKRYKNHSLIIKFPDQELNRDIVSKFHPSIENVHFQQPSTPRFCFVTLQESADAESVISALNKIKFGEGHLTAEYKKDREEDQNIGPEDIDPCTLYVGNLAQEITKEDMVKTYPTSRRIDIGYAKKMKYTRYAFVSFKNVSESIDAFKKTHSTQMYSKSLIVRFRRLHGTVGMPGESKPQSPAKKTDSNNQQEQTSERPESTTSCEVHEQNSTVVNDSLHSEVDLSVVKQEVNSSDDEITVNKTSKNYESPYMVGSIDVAFEQHRPMIKKEIKRETEDDDLSFVQNSSGTQANGSIVQIKPEKENHPTVKRERDEDDESSDDDYGGRISDVNFSSLLNQLEDHSNQIESLRKSVP